MQRQGLIEGDSDEDYYYSLDVRQTSSEELEDREQVEESIKRALKRRASLDSVRVMFGFSKSDPKVLEQKAAEARRMLEVRSQERATSLINR